MIQICIAIAWMYELLNGGVHAIRMALVCLFRSLHGKKGSKTYYRCTASLSLSFRTIRFFLLFFRCLHFTIFCI